MQSSALEMQPQAAVEPHLWRIAEIGNPNSSDPPYRLELLEFDGTFTVQATYFGRKGRRGPKQWCQDVLLTVRTPWYAVKTFDEKLTERLAKPGHELLRAEGDGPDLYVSNERAVQAVSAGWIAHQDVQRQTEAYEEIKALVEYYCQANEVNEIVSPDGVAYRVQRVSTTKYAPDPALIQLLLERGVCDVLNIVTTRIRAAIEEGQLTEAEVEPYLIKNEQIRGGFAPVRAENS